MSHRVNKRRLIICAFGALAFAVAGPIKSAPSSEPDPRNIFIREPARGVLLVANSRLRDANFSRSVVLLTDHGPDGSVGLIINKQSSVAITTIIPGLEALESPETNLHFGGSLSIRSVRILVRSPVEIDSSERIIQGVYFINSIEVLRGLLEKDKSIASQTMKYFAGYAAWSPGQLDAELAQGDWHMATASETTVFSKDVDGIWMELVEKLEGTWVLLDNPSSKRGN
jgi:putative transcriptional regulator